MNAQTLDKVSYQTNWRAQAEHGGFYLAVANGIYKKYGIDCDLRMGGPQQNPSQLLLGGRVDMIMSNAFEGINYVKENLPFLCIAAIFQKDPQVLISHPNVGNDTLADLKGKPILIGAGGRTSYWPFLRAKFGFTDDQIRPYTFNMAPFLADKNISQQGFLSSEPYVIMQAGVQPRGAPARRRRLRELPDHDQHLAQDGGGEEGPRAALRQRLARGLGRIHEGWACQRSRQRHRSRRTTRTCRMTRSPTRSRS